MLKRTRQLWEKQNRLVGDRTGLFAAVADAVEVNTVLYPGSYVDITPSFTWSCLTYLDLTDGSFDLLVNSSHGDAAMASLDAQYRVDGVVVSR